MLRIRRLSFEEHFGKQIASYLPRQVLLDYVEGHVKKANVRDWINHDDAFGKFTVMAHNYNQDTSYSVEFNYIVVAS